MELTVLFASPRKNGNTAALLDGFCQEWEHLGGTVERIDLYDRTIQPCRGCRGCQKNWEAFACVCADDVPDLFRRLRGSDLILFATPIYSWYCTPPMKALMDRLIYGACKFYGKERGPALLEGKRAASLVTCGYPPEKGADLWEQGLRRWCRHAHMKDLGLYAGHHLGYDIPFPDEETAQGVRAFARTLWSLCGEEKP